MTVNGDYNGGSSVIDRHLARAYETLKIAEAMKGWVNELDSSRSYDDGYTQYSGTGVGLTEAPRGALGHWVQIVNGKIAHYQNTYPHLLERLTKRRQWCSRPHGAGPYRNPDPGYGKTH